MAGAPLPTAMLLHVRYVADPESGPDLGPGELLRAAWTDPLGLAAAVAVVAGLAALVWWVGRPAWAGFRAALDDALALDHEMVPWVLRLSTGIALLGAGLQGHWFLPHLDLESRGLVALLALAVGFALLVGLAVRVAALFGLALYVLALLLHGPDLLMATEVVAGLVVLLVGAASRPSLDEYLAHAFPAAPGPWRRLACLGRVLGPSRRPVPPWAPTVLRVGLGLSFLAAGLLEKFLDPGPAIATAERYGLAIGPASAEVVVATIGLLEVLLGLLLALGVAPRALSAVAFVVLTVTLFALPDDPVLGHVALWGVASAVFLLGRHGSVTDAREAAPTAD